MMRRFNVWASENPRTVCLLLSSNVIGWIITVVTCH